MVGSYLYPAYDIDSVGLYFGCSLGNWYVASKKGRLLFERIVGPVTRLMLSDPFDDCSRCLANMLLMEVLGYIKITMQLFPKNCLKRRLRLVEVHILPSNVHPQDLHVATAPSYVTRQTTYATSW